MTSDIRVDGERLWRSIMDMAEIGATANGGSHRLTLSDEDKVARDRFAGWCADASLASDPSTKWATCSPFRAGADRGSRACRYGQPP